MAEQDEKRYFLPDALRVDLDSAESQALLAQSREQQAKWREIFGQPYLSATSHDRERARASLIIEEYERYGRDNLVDSQLDELAHAYAAVGLYLFAVAAAPTEELKRQFADVQQAIEKDDAEHCGHGQKQMHALRDVYSIGHEGMVSVMRCPECGDLNAIPTPVHVERARSKRAEIRSKYSGLKPLEAKARMEADGVR